MRLEAGGLARISVATATAWVLALAGAAPAMAQEHPVQSMFWPADLVEPAGEAWISDRSVGPAKQYFRQWARRVNSSAPTAGIEASSACPPEAAIIKMTIAANGQAQATTVLRSSGLPRFDAFTLANVASLGPFPVPPAELLLGRETITVVGLFSAAYTGRASEGSVFLGFSHVNVDAPLAPFDPAVWKRFDATFEAALRQDLARTLPKPRMPVDLTIFFEFVDEDGIDATKVFRGDNDPRFRDLALARAHEVAMQFKTPGRHVLQGFALHFHFDGARPATPASAS